MTSSKKEKNPQNSFSSTSQKFITPILIIISLLVYFALYNTHSNLNTLITSLCPDHLHVFSVRNGKRVYTNIDEMMSSSSTSSSKTSANPSQTMKWAQGFVVNENTGRFVFVAKSREELVKKFGKCKKWTELHSDEEMIMPSFIDAHLHIILGGQSLLGAPLQNVQSKQEFMDVFREYSVNGYGQHEPWITGGYWSESSWGGEIPTRHWIDHVDKPAFLMRMDGHSALVNSKALELAGVTRDTPDPRGGTIVRDDDGEATGLLKDKAIELVYKFVPPLNEDKALDVAMEHAVRFGITSVHHMGALGKVGGAMAELRTYKKAEIENRLKFRIRTSIELKNMHQLKEFIEEYGTGSDWLRYDMLKEFFDGSLGSKTALQYSREENVPDSNPYIDTEEVGLQVHDDNELLDWLREAEKLKFQVAIHAIGEKAIDKLVDMYEQVFKENPSRDRRWRIEHVQQSRPQTRKRFAELGIAVCINPTHLLFDSAYAASYVGEKGCKNLYAFDTLFDSLKAKPLVSIGSDWFVSPLNPLLAIDAAVNRITESHPDGFNPEARVSLEQVIKAYTLGSAYAGFNENQLGRIKPGYLADFVVLNKNLFEIEKTELKNVVVQKTFVHGRCVYSREEDPQVRQRMSGENSTDLELKIIEETSGAAVME
uniref:Amidohydrolase 3 domain-containing protein n=1 Tax=Percolomonas cosmopolitus TaxID=63605 RepID=A0A7S1KLY2_9EUKA|mmetsp:Transcript_1156/g.3988  ORF Transcript_1156/g.3988 Transcript_1156/m.3988 type:complete len:654 (+) Transcript_1156:313-2274(+)|eukprot:CAMPEP_0117452130 /NCGR_PEP_ID=MMETSP0759-20121206/9420_1 /TAXON_ID=63605 /ORGANISM="Percolomonas cosmopolitus, Strain WS" /LENGTH=653 /DNA_ID=CAMNT_0005244863 /DNA_START=109 /DNA_END=2070 /DNA_ORIENTATION=-